MDFEKKMKMRFNIAIIYVALGIMMIVGANISKSNGEYISSWGLALTVCGFVRIRNYFMITKNEETMRKQRVAETDERNLAIVNKARSVTFYVYVLCAGAAVIVLSVLEKHEPAKIIAYSVCVLMVIYWVSYFIIKRRA